MRVAFFSPMPPARSGIADYSAALVEPLGRLVELEVFDCAPAGYNASRFDIALYQIGNNPHHEFVYETALRHPGMIVLHEANLHYLLADLTIRRGDWDAYIREVEYNAGPEALAYAARVRALEVGPDYEGIPMTRRILESARGVIVHSSAVEEHVRSAGFRGPVARIPHGAWLPEADRWAYRERLGIDETTPLIGIFGFLKPYKRIAESLRAFRRLLRVEPRAKMILAGEPHPDFPVESVIRTLGLEGSVRVLGFVDIADFTGYMAASDIVLNLRYPTVGESSGSLLRAFGLGKPVLVSDVGAFRDLADDTCFKVRAGSSEEDEIFEYLNQLVSRPELARALGARARDWAERECSWDRVAEQYAGFLEAVVENRGAEDVAACLRARFRAEPAVNRDREGADSTPAPPQAPAGPETILEWSPPDPLFREYVDTHLTRLTKTLEITPAGGPADRILEMGAYLQITPALRSRLGYGEVRGCYYGKLGEVERRSVVSTEGERFECDLDLFNAEKDVFPYPNAHFATILCCELVEHLFEDPMHMMAEINRILKGGGHLVLTTPNIASLRAISAILQGYHPGLFPQYIKPSENGQVDPRHNREYAPREIRQLFEDSGFEVIRLETGPFRDQPRPELAWVSRLLDRHGMSRDLRGDGIYAVGRKIGPVRSRYPEWLYA
jgi:glycosyltransferase involved in cell wall biosynthesis/SAM-dependent methyltransferase